MRNIQQKGYVRRSAHFSEKDTSQKPMFLRLKLTASLTNRQELKITKKSCLTLIDLSTIVCQLGRTLQITRTTILSSVSTCAIS